MAGPPKTRGMFKYVFDNFMKSLKVGQRQKVGNVMGQDPYGNTYYELPAQPELGKRRPTRWYNTVDTNKKDIVHIDTVAGFDAELPSEWESWLRHRRADPPTEKQVMQSLAMAEMKKINAAKLEEVRHAEMVAAGLDPSPPGLQDHEKTPYPKYAEFEVAPGESQLQNKDKWEKFKNPYSKQQEGDK